MSGSVSLNSIVQGLFYCLLTIYISLFSTLSVADDIPELSAWMIDKTNTLSVTQQSELNSLLENHEKQTNEQFIILMIPTLNGESIEEYALRVFEKWQLGQKDKDNGLLLVIAKNDRKLRIEVGYGLEGKITDVISGRIIRNDIAPHFKNNDYFGGINNGVHRLLEVSKGAMPPSEPNSDVAVPSKYSPEFLSVLRAVDNCLFIFYILIPLCFYIYVRFILKKEFPYLWLLAVLVSILPVAIMYYIGMHALSFIRGVVLPNGHSTFFDYLNSSSTTYLYMVIAACILNIIYQIIKSLFLDLLGIIFSRNFHPKKSAEKTKSRKKSSFFSFSMGSSSGSSRRSSSRSSSGSSGSSSRPSGGGGRSGGGGASGGW